MSTWFRQQRLDWILESLEIFGFMNRDHIMKKFGVSQAQAALDLREAQKRWPDLMAYNASAKRYERVR